MVTYVTSSAKGTATLTAHGAAEQLAKGEAKKIARYDDFPISPGRLVSFVVSLGGTLSPNALTLLDTLTEIGVSNNSDPLTLYRTTQASTLRHMKTRISVALQRSKAISVLTWRAKHMRIGGAAAQPTDADEDLSLIHI